MDNKLTRGRRFRHILVLPFIWMVLIPLLFLDIVMEIYHRIGFALCNLPYVERSNYIKIDRHKLSYLDPIGKLNCMYCGYSNGLFNYLSVIGARTEAYWCGVQHKQDTDFQAPDHHKNFVEYGNEQAFKKKYSRK